MSRTPGQGPAESVQHITSDALFRNPAFTHAVVVSGPGKTIYVGGQDAVDGSGALIGKGNLKMQAEQVLKNLQSALAAAGAQLHHVIKWNVIVVQGQPLQPGYEVFQTVWGSQPNPPVINVALVSGLAHPDFLIEMDAVASVPEA